MTPPEQSTTDAAEPVIVEVQARDGAWQRHYGLSYETPTRAAAEERVDIARRIWPGRQYRIVPAGDRL